MHTMWQISWAWNKRIDDGRVIRADGFSLHPTAEAAYQYVDGKNGSSEDPAEFPHKYVAVQVSDELYEQYLEASSHYVEEYKHLRVDLITKKEMREQYNLEWD